MKKRCVAASLLLLGSGSLLGQQPTPLAVPAEIAHAEVTRALVDARAFLPVDFALEALAGTAVAVHRLDDTHVAQVVEQDGTLVLLLSERSFFAGGRMVALSDAAIDTVAYLFEALFELHAERALRADPRRRAELETTAGSLYEDLSPDRRLEALIDAQAQYAGHLVSIAATVERSARRGSRICAKLDAPLFQLWEQTGDQIDYLGTVWVDGRWKTSKIDLPPTLRRSVRVDTLEGRWTGSARADFGSRYCR